ncbi:MAG: type II toxin-antitoxin system death-on-curing family toxin [Proteobacteria bacterium]|nr:type II toxin-antitoxin system death-on-curing family toxin [Pseudomonadota bacterium]
MASPNPGGLFRLFRVRKGGIVKNHPFVDGNKRAGALAAAAFLDLNGYDLQPAEPEVVTMIMGLAAGEIEEDTLARWISENSTPKPK